VVVVGLALACHAAVAGAEGTRGVPPSVAKQIALPGDRIAVQGRVAEVFDPHVFRVADGSNGDDGLLVIVVTPYASPGVGERVLVRGVARRFRPDALRRRYGWDGWFASPEAGARRGALAVFARSVRSHDGIEFAHEGPPPRPR
jgi:hypothetical protein